MQDLLREGSKEDVDAALAPFQPADVADVVEGLPDEEAAKLLNCLDATRRGEVFEQLEPEHQKRLADKIGSEGLTPIVSAMSADDRADLLNTLPGEVVSGVISRLPADEAKDVATLRTYAPETAGGIMTSEFVRLSPEMSASEATERVREQATKKETIYALYVLDAKEHIVGVVSLTKLILAPKGAKVGEIMYTNPISMPVDADQEAVAQKLRHYDFLAMPVVDATGRMVGIVTHDDVLDVVLDEQTEDVQKMAAVEPLEASYFATGVMTLVRKRATWLTVLFCGGLVAGSVLSSFQGTLSRTMALVFFLPLIIAAGGNSGSQSATLVIRGLAVREIALQDWWRIARREALSGLLLGTLLGTFGCGVALLLGKGPVAPTVFLTLLGVVTVGALLGSQLPIVLARLGVDPAITSSPLVASMSDVIGILIYLSVAMALLGL